MDDIIVKIDGKVVRHTNNIIVLNKISGHSLLTVRDSHILKSTAQTGHISEATNRTNRYNALKNANDEVNRVNNMLKSADTADIANQLVLYRQQIIKDFADEWCPKPQLKYYHRTADSLTNSDTDSFSDSTTEAEHETWARMATRKHHIFKQNTWKSQYNACHQKYTVIPNDNHANITVQNSRPEVSSQPRVEEVTVNDLNQLAIKFDEIARLTKKEKTTLAKILNNKTPIENFPLTYRSKNKIRKAYTIIKNEPMPTKQKSRHKFQHTEPITKILHESTPDEQKLIDDIFQNATILNNNIFIHPNDLTGMNDTLKATILRIAAQSKLVYPTRYNTTKVQPNIPNQDANKYQTHNTHTTNNPSYTDTGTSEHNQNTQLENEIMTIFTKAAEYRITKQQLVRVLQTYKQHNNIHKALDLISGYARENAYKK